MKILWVKAGKLLPVDTGGKIRSYNILRELAARHETVLFSYYGGEKDTRYETAIRDHFHGAVTCHRNGLERTAMGRSLDYLLRLPASLPYAVAKFTFREVERTLEPWIRDRRFDVAVCDFLSASASFPRTLATPTVLFQHNVESILWRRLADQERSWLTKRAFQIEAEKMARYERAAVSRFHHVIAVSEHDREQMAAMADASKITVVPTGVDLQRYHSTAQPTSARPVVLFMGSMDWAANVDAVEYFCREIWPRVSAEVPEARFRIVGRNPDLRVRKLACNSVEVTGTVPSVVEHLAGASVFVVPLRVGGGTRLKIYEAMAMSKAVVSTSVGAEGLDVHDGQDIMLRDDPTGFAASVVAVLRDERLRAGYGAAAARLAAQYGWPSIAERFSKVLETVASFEYRPAGSRSQS